MLKSAGVSRRQSFIGGNFGRDDDSDENEERLYGRYGQSGEGAAAAGLGFGLPVRSRAQSMSVDVLSWRNQAILNRMQDNIALPSVKHL